MDNLEHLTVSRRSHSQSPRRACKLSLAQQADGSFIGHYIMRRTWGMKPDRRHCTIRVSPLAAMMTFSELSRHVLVSILLWAEAVPAQAVGIGSCLCTQVRR
jgi:hypothetical protein